MHSLSFSLVPTRVVLRRNFRLTSFPVQASSFAKESEVVNEKFNVYAISDLHTDNQENFNWVKKLATNRFQHDVLIVAGDISHRLPTLKSTLQELLFRFRRVAFVPGNHELWVTKRWGKSHRKKLLVTSMEKLERINEMCEELGVITQATQLGKLWLIPLLSWHHTEFDQDCDDLDFLQNKWNKISDYKFCDWSDLNPAAQQHGATELAQHFDELNPSINISPEECDIISFSHFLPRRDLLPDRSFLVAPFLGKVVGSTYLNRRIMDLRPDIHVFGHSHIAWDIQLDGVRFVQCPLGQPRERRARPNSMLSTPFSWDPRIKFNRSGERHKWNGETADWLPVKIYTHCPESTSSAGDPGKEQEEEVNGSLRSLKFNGSRELRFGEMHQSYALWSEYYKRESRRLETADQLQEVEDG